MFSLSVEQAVEIWSELEQAYFGSNKYGGNVAEIYAFRLLPHSPSQVSGIPGKLYDEGRLQRAELAAESLHTLLVKFSEHRDADVEVDGVRVEPKKRLQPFDHRVHVAVWKREKT